MRPSALAASMQRSSDVSNGPRSGRKRAFNSLVRSFVRTRAGLRPDVLEAYVRRAIATTYVDGYRRRRTFQGVRHLASAPESMAGPDSSAPDRLDLHAALADLGRQERTAVVLRFFDDLTVGQVAEVMGLAEGSVKRYLSNAVRRLEQRLGPIDPPAATSDIAVVTTTLERG